MLIILFAISFITTIVSIGGLNYSRDRISGLEAPLMGKIKNDDVYIDDDYPLSIYIKDTYINIGIYKDTIKLLTAIQIIALISMIILLKKNWRY